jgi:predicted  nucleic acid-binding Zn-ribbon protein
MNQYLAQLEQLAVPLAIAAVIFVFSLISFGVWASRIRQVQSEVVGLNRRLTTSDASSREALTLAESETADKELKFLLRETEAGLIDLPTQHGVRQGPNSSQGSYSFRSHADTWTVRSVLGGRMNLALFETMPNLLIGFGLMCTFIFLAVALQQAGLALNALDVSARQQDQALQSLIATAGGKFITSIAGLLCSLVWNWRAKVSLENLQASIDTLCHTLRAKVPDNAAEASVRMQLALFQDILDENRSQVSQLRRFEGDFANAIGDALARNMQPAFDKLGTLADTIQTSSQSFGSAGTQAAGELSKAGAAMTQGIENGLASFGDAVGILSQTIQNTRATITELDASLARASAMGQQGTQHLETLLGSLGQTVQSVQGAMSGLQGTVARIDETAEKFKDSAVAIEGAVSLQRAAATDFKEALIPMNQALGQTVDTLQQSAVSAEEALGHVRSHLQDAQKALTGTVDALTKGVSGYSTQIADLHNKMDQHLASAVNQLGGSITNLEEVLDEFIDALPPKA